jgi:hypothetical protein
MNRLAPSILLAASILAAPTLTRAQDSNASASPGQSEKAIQKQQLALYKYQKAQEKAQAKAQRKSDKQQRKAAKSYEKQQRKLLKASAAPTKHVS